MKYLLVGLILFAGLVRGPTVRSFQPVHTFAASHLGEVTADQETSISVYMNETPTSTRVGLSVFQSTRSCIAGVCRSIPTVSGYSYQEVARSEAHIDRDIRNAAIHGPLQFHDDIAGDDVSVRIDVVWIGTGSIQCVAQHDESECSRTASVIGDVAIQSNELVHNATALDGQLSWSQPAL